GRSAAFCLAPRPKVPVSGPFSVFPAPRGPGLGFSQWRHPRPEPAKADTPGSVGWHELLASDPDAAFPFYSELLGWQKQDRDEGEPGPYQLFSAGDEPIGAMATKLPTMTDPFWLYYFNVGGVEGAAQRVTAGGGEVVGVP